MNPTTPIYVYGTLRSNEGNYSWALKGRTVSEEPATLRGARMHDNNGGFPFVAMFDATEDDTVVGDLMYLDADTYRATMNDLDGLEGFHGEGYAGNMYDRVLVTVTTAAGAQVEAYTYLTAPGIYNRQVQYLPLVTSGDWVTYADERRAALRATRAAEYAPTN